MNYDVVIVGAGIVGAACADACSGRGMKVAVLDGSAIASGATAAAMGHIVVMDDSEAQFALTRYSQQLWHELGPDLPAEVEFEKPGTIWIAADEEEMIEVHRKAAYFGARGVAVEILDATDLAKAEPNLRAGLRGGLLVAEDCVLNPARAAQFLMERAQSRGARVYAGLKVSRIGKGKVSAGGGEFAAAAIINAAGVGAARLSPGWDIRERKGHLAMTDCYPGYVRHQLVELSYLKSAHTHNADSVAFNVQPRRNGQIIIGSSRQYGAQSEEVEPEMMDRMIERAAEFMPGLRSLVTVRTWTGFRAATPDKLPLIGPLPEDNSVFLATGHEGLGITTSTGTGRLIADLVNGRETAIPSQPYLPSRVRRGSLVTSETARDQEGVR